MRQLNDARKAESNLLQQMVDVTVEAISLMPDEALMDPMTAVALHGMIVTRVVQEHSRSEETSAAAPGAAHAPAAADEHSMLRLLQSLSDALRELTLSNEGLDRMDDGGGDGIAAAVDFRQLQLARLGVLVQARSQHVRA